MGRVRAIINGMDIFMLRGPGQAKMSANLAIMYDDVQTPHDACIQLAPYMNIALTLPDDELPLEVPLVFYSRRIHQHPHGMRGLFEYLQKDDDDGAVVIPYGCALDGTQIVKPSVRPMPVFPPLAPLAPPAQPGQPVAPGAVPQPDPNVLLNSVMAAI